jgi:hypothetical protein
MVAHFLFLFFLLLFLYYSRSSNVKEEGENIVNEWTEVEKKKHIMLIYNIPLTAAIRHLSSSSSLPLKKKPLVFFFALKHQVGDARNCPFFLKSSQISFMYHTNK